MTQTLPNTAAKRGRTTLMILLSIGSFWSYGQDFSNTKNIKPINVNGSLEGRGTFYQASGIQDRRQPFAYLLNGSAAVSIYGLSIPFSIAYSESNSSFSQPFNQFGMSPTYKWVTLHAGYRNIDYSPYTLGGHTMLGAGVELNPGKLRFGLMRGRLNRANAVDSTSQVLVPVSFSRKGTAAKLGYGTDRNFFEFSYLQAKDDSTSLDLREVRKADYVTPASNNVVGYNYRFSFLKHFTLESKGALSIYTRDVNSTLAFSEVDNKVLQKVQDLIALNGTSEFYTALDASLNYRSKYFGLKANYKRIEPEYKTMGAYFFNSDLESWTFGPSVNLLNNKIRISGSIGTQRDNLLDQKRSTNKRLIGSGTVGVEFNKSLALDLNYSNFSNDQQPNTLRFPDSLRIVQTTSNITVTPRYMIVRPALVQVFSVSAGLNKLNDFNQIITSNNLVSRTIDTRQFFFNYVANLPKKGISMFFNLNRTELRSELINNTYQGLTLGGNSTILKNKLQLGINSSFIQSKGLQGSSIITNSSGNLSYKVTKRQVLKTALFLTSNRPPSGGTQKAFTEFRNELSYLVNF
ncbi:MAG: hypothetical protein V4594_09175 [Bacteroidota bacterium]